MEENQRLSTIVFGAINVYYREIPDVSKLRNINPEPLLQCRNIMAVDSISPV